MTRLPAVLTAGTACKAPVRIHLAVALALGAALVVAAAPAQARDAAASLASAKSLATTADRLDTEARQLAQWVARSGDHQQRPFYIVDKKNARLHAFTADGRLVATSPVLLGAARGDDSVPGIGDRKIGEIRPHERTTPAGRFVGERGRNLTGETIVWVDYDAAVSMHRVRANNKEERRLERLATSTAADNRISYGCINVPAAFFDAHVWPSFHDGGKAMIYVLPETRPLASLFPVTGASHLGRTASAAPR